MIVSPFTAQAPSLQAASDAKSAYMNYDAFLRLLVAQMKAQDPTQPADSAQYLSQLASFSAVEQGVKTNAKLDDLMTSLALSQADATDWPPPPCWAGRSWRWPRSGPSAAPWPRCLGWPSTSSASQSAICSPDRSGAQRPRSTASGARRSRLRSSGAGMGLEPDCRANCMRVPSKRSKPCTDTWSPVPRGRQLRSPGSSRRVCDVRCAASPTGST